MGFLKTSRFLVVMLLAGGFLLAIPAGTAVAAKQAVVKLAYRNSFFGGTYFGLRTGGTYGSVTVTVNTTTTPTPTIMWPADVVQCIPGTGCFDSSFTYSGALTVFASRMGTFMNLPGAIGKSHPGAAPSPSSMLYPALAATVNSPVATTKCFATITAASATPGTPNLPGECFPRLAQGSRTPGSKKFGGTARMFQGNSVVGTIRAQTGNSNFSVGFLQSPDLFISPDVAPAYGLAASGTFTNTVTGLPRNTQAQQTQAPLTTGRVTAMGGDYGTQQTFTGSHNLNTTNLTGMISMARPALSAAFGRNGAGQYTGSFLRLGALNRLIITFAGEVPEPGAALLIGSGVLGLVGLTRRYRNSL